MFVCLYSFFIYNCDIYMLFLVEGDVVDVYGGVLVNQLSIGRNFLFILQIYFSVILK